MLRRFISAVRQASISRQDLSPRLLLRLPLPLSLPLPPAPPACSQSPTPRSIARTSMIIASASSGFLKRPRQQTLIPTRPPGRTAFARRFYLFSLFSRSKAACCRWAFPVMANMYGQHGCCDCCGWGQAGAYVHPFKRHYGLGELFGPQPGVDPFTQHMQYFVGGHFYNFGFTGPFFTPSNRPPVPDSALQM